MKFEAVFKSKLDDISNLSSLKFYYTVLLFDGLDLVIVFINKTNPELRRAEISGDYTVSEVLELIKTKIKPMGKVEIKYTRFAPKPLAVYLGMQMKKLGFSWVEIEAL